MIKEIFMLLLKALWFMIPSYLANATPVLVYRIKFLGIPVDFGKKFRGKRIFGDHKTWRGLFFGVLFGTIVAIIQYYLAIIPFIREITVIPLNLTTFIEYGALISAGALTGDLVESFFKRQIGIKPGKDWPVFDQYDFIIGSWVFTFWLWPKSIVFYIWVLSISPILHILSGLTKPFFMKKKKK